MPSLGNGFEQAYNAKAGVDVDFMLIVEKHITQNPNDKQEIEPALRKLYAKRKSTVEPVLGIIKNIMKFRRFLLRGLTAVRGEWSMVCIAWSLKRIRVLMA